MQVEEYELLQRESFRVVEWRRDAFRELGVSDDMAVELAEAGVDHHALARLVEAGCDPQLAAEILR